MTRYPDKFKVQETEKQTVSRRLIKRRALSGEQIDNDLSKAANKAINGIAKRDYNRIIGDMAKEINDPGLASRGYSMPIQGCLRA